MTDEARLKAIRAELIEAQVLIELLYIHLLAALDGPSRDRVFASLENKALQMTEQGLQPKMLMSVMQRLRNVEED